MKVFLASDHAGFALKEKVKAFLLKNGYDTRDCGASSFQEGDDYPDYIAPCARAVAEDPSSLGIIFGKSGEGEAIVANKIKGIRAAVGFNEENIRLSRSHNNANILSLGSDFALENEASGFVHTFLTTPFSGEERHKRRIEKIAKIEEENAN